LSSDFGLRTLDFGPLRFEHSRCSLLCFLLCVHGTNFKSNVKGDGQECPPHIFGSHLYSLAWRRRRALVMTDTELKLIAAAAKMGLSRMPKNGYRMPAAMGTPRAL